MTIAGGDPHQLAHHLPTGLTEAAEQLPVVQEVGTQHLGDGEGPQEVANVREHLLAEQDAEEGAALGGTRRAQPSALAGEGYEQLAAAAVAAHAREAALVDAAVEEGVGGVLAGAAPGSAAAGEALVPLALDLLVVALQQAIQRRAACLPRSVQGGAGCGQGYPMPLSTTTRLTVTATGGKGWPSGSLTVP